MPHINSKTNSLTQSSLLLPFQYAAILGVWVSCNMLQYLIGEGPDLFLESGLFQNWLGLSNLCEIL